MKSNPSKPSKPQVSLERRDLLKLSALGAASFFIHGCGSPGSPGAKKRGPNEKLNLAVIGCGGMGFHDLESVMSENVVALCDVDTHIAKGARELCPEARFYFDWRDLLDAERDLDAVVISTPDHNHAPVAAHAMHRGLHCRVQKPLTHTVEEARLLASLAREKGLVTQMGNQGTAMAGFREGVEVIRSGAIGNVHTVHVWTNRPVWPQAIPRPEGTKPIPEHLRFDLFLGPAPYRPYHDGYHPFAWRGFWDFGTGALGDMACHIMNLAYYALELGAPERVECIEQQGNNDETAPARSIVKYRFPSNGKRPAVEVLWYDGDAKPPADLLPGMEWSVGGSLLIGDEGLMYVDDEYGAHHRLFPEERFKDYRPPAPWLPRAPVPLDAEGKPRPTWSISAEWLAAIRGEGEASSAFDTYAGPFTEAVLLGNVAVRTGRELRWDWKNLRAIDVPEASRYIKKSYARGFSLTGL
jgi:predicted dehydrogenase